MARCCASPDVRYTPVLPKPLKANLRRSPKTSRSYLNAREAKPPAIAIAFYTVMSAT